MRGWFGLIAALALLSCIPDTSQAQDVAIKITNVETPEVDGIGPRDVYGAVTYELASYRTAEEYQNAIQKLLSRVGDHSGKYLFALQLKTSNPEPLAIVPIAQAQIDERKKFIFFPESYKYVSKTSWRGVVINGPTVEQLTNNLKVVLVAYYSESSQVNFDSFTQLSGLWNTASAVALSGAGAAASLGVWNVVKDAVSSLLKSMKEIEVTDETSMSFIKATPVDPKTILIETLTPGGGNKLKLTVKFVTKPSKFEARYNLTAGKFMNAKSDEIWQEAKVGGADVQSLLMTADDTDTRNFFVELRSDAGYVGPNIEARCQGVKDLFAKYFNSRDVYAVYWSFLKRNETNLKKNPLYKTCLKDETRQDLEEIGLNTAGLLN
jgi:hypothetical protein